MRRWSWRFEYSRSMPPSTPHLATQSFGRAVAIMSIAAAFLIMVGTAASAASILPLGEVNFQVLNAAGTDVIGRTHYELSRGSDNLLVGQGESHFKDGERDVEYDTLEVSSSQALAMLTLDHKFYNADGSMQRDIVANFRTDQASCTRYRNGVAYTNTAKLDFTADSYGGAAIVLPLEQDLSQGSRRLIKLQALNCIPKPRLIAVNAYVREPEHWSHYPGQTVEVDIKPDLGWLNVVLAPFLPQLRAWFDPSDHWMFVGGEFSRYFRGPRIMLVREIPEELRKAKQHASRD